MKISGLATLVVLSASTAHAAFTLNQPSSGGAAAVSSRHNRFSQQHHAPLFAATLKTTPVQEEKTGTTVGDTRGAALRLEDVAISRGATPLLKNIQWSVQPKERWGIVGPNGAGKSTLLGAITGTVRMDEGKALVGSKVRVGYLKQSAVSGSTKTVAEESMSEMTAIENAKERLRIVSEKLEAGDYEEATLEEFSDAQEEFEQVGGYEQEQLVDTVLKGLGFEPEDSGRLCADFSGGWQMRIALARLLLSQPSLLLLDEPSNHLDSSARDWLGKYIAGYDGAVVLVSHDIGLLDAGVNSIAEINGNTLIEYRGCAYSKYLEEKEFRATSAQAEYERNLEEAARLQAFVDKFGASATKAASAQSRVKMLEKMKREGKLDPPPVAVISKGRDPELVLPPPPKPIGEDLLKVENAVIGYDPNEEPLLKNIDLAIPRGMKLLLRGPNGAGKSTLLKALRGNLPHMLFDGTRTENEKLRLGVFTQDLAQELDVNARAIDLVTAYAREGQDGNILITDEKARNVMGRLNLAGDKPLRKVGELSGGEKARVALSMFSLKASNLLMLDEPSNHLDVGCINALAKALSGWGGKDGAVVVISHDRSFCEEVGFTHVGTVMNGKLKLEQRPLQDSDWDQYDIGAANSKFE
uniref:ABC transporter domain-containing protein n=1 Tax=Grammatophora oceanica TaxID=210454 RepID=A0A7S1UPJ2_9STRA|mmetsp:Transcript_15931/g.23500  ORF Transcript_15931/g.23500 Transcript_15931/m.23500 type:complete len:639 (+) Transcript_15931:67-1983(+)